MERRLAAILAIDVVGYTRLMERDEEETLTKLHNCRQLIERMVGVHDGRTFGRAGDSVLADFASPVKAVRCAIKIQHEMAQVNQTLAAVSRMQLRIGVHLGDAIVDDGNLFGEGVNIAARLEQNAEPGGILVSHDVVRQSKGKIGAAFEKMGPQQLKNVAEPMQTYRVVLASDAPNVTAPQTRRIRPLVAAITAVVIVCAVAISWQLFWRADTTRDEPAQAAMSNATDETQTQATTTPTTTDPEKPSIAVLPFQNMSGDVEQTFFADGMAEDIITDLSKLSGLFVISRNSSFRYRGDDVDLDKVRRELGVRYVLEGSVRRAGNQVRINAQLIDTDTAGHLWAERYDGQLDNVFALQDRMTANIVEALTIKLGAGERASLENRGTTNINAYDAYLKGQEFYLRKTPQDTANAIEQYKLALKFDPTYAPAAAALADAFLTSARLNWTFIFGLPSYAGARNEANHYSEMALALDPESALAHAVKAQLIYFVPQRRFDAAIAEARKAIALDPNSATAYLVLGSILVYGGEPERAFAHLELARQLDPANFATIEDHLAVAYFSMERFTEAVEHGENALAATPENTFVIKVLAAAFGLMGEHSKAVSMVERLNAIRQSQHKRNYSVQTIDYNKAWWFFRRDEDTARLRDGLLKAGVH